MYTPYALPFPDHGCWNCTFISASATLLAAMFKGARANKKARQVLVRQCGELVQHIGRHVARLATSAGGLSPGAKSSGEEEEEDEAPTPTAASRGASAGASARSSSVDRSLVALMTERLLGAANAAVAMDGFAVQTHAASHLLGALLQLPFGATVASQAPLSLLAEVTGLLQALIKHRLAAVHASIHLVLDVARGMLVPALAQAMRAAPTDQAAAARRLQHVSRVYEDLAQHPQALRHYAVYAVVDFVRQAQASRGLYDRARRTLFPGLFALLDACGEPETQQMFATLDTTGRIIFKRLHEEYKDRHKYRGDV